MAVEYEDLNAYIGKIIKKYRQKKNITQEKLGEMTNLDAANISRIERGEHIPNTKTYIKLVYGLNINQDDYIEKLNELIHKEESESI